MRRQNVLKNQKGQMALFLVLIFQVLFVFFAMSINVGLVVYDKINLQNSTDIAAYYAAQKQSEMLNQIAHINYQIRQAYKLLTFRVRVLGSLSIGMGANTTLPRHPIFSNQQLTSEGNPFFPRLGVSRHAPGVCVGSTLWYEYGITEGNASASLCQDLLGITVVPPITGSGDPLGLIGGLNDFLNAITSEVRERCITVGVLDWQVAASFLSAYVLDADRRMQMIRALSTKLSTPATEMQDHLGGSVFNGALNTLKKNLTEPQRETVQLKMLNSLSSDMDGPCSDPNFWLPSVDLHPLVTYVRMIWNPTPGRCIPTVVSNRGNVADILPPAADLQSVGGRNNALLTSVWTNNSPIASGVEKNPWCMPYMKLSATTRPRKIFAPFGGETVLKAESFAKPFGGRIGPWYSKQWPSGSPTSQGLDRIDPLLPARSISGQRVGGASEDDLVNHSKYPGDVNGMNSSYALGSMYNYFYNTVIRRASLSQLPPILALAHFNHIGDPDEFDSKPDSLARTNTSPITGDPIRYMELAAISPDLFDITYYSIEGQYSANFFNTEDVHFSTNDQFSRYFLDLGSQSREPYSVVDQINSSQQVFAEQQPFYHVESPNQILTGWTQNGAVNYEFPEQFGKCLMRNDGDIMAKPSPSGCPQGGRSGYSVKIVSKNYLMSVDAELGGAGLSGAILNPPPAD
jgi:Putative Flp pilus-assembly TadE/G-like